jgi:putative membrane protein
MLRHLSAYVVLTAGLFVGFAGDQEGIGGTKQSEGPLPIDNEFLAKAFVSGHKEVMLGKLVVGQSTNEPVKKFAQMVVDDHTKTNRKIAELLKSRKIAVVAGVEKDTKDAAAKLSKLEGEAFDRVYIRDLVQDHQEAVALFEHQANSGKDADVTSFAKDALPVLRRHLQEAQKLASSIGTK